MRSLSFEVDGGRDNVVQIPIENPGTATAGRLLVDTGNGMSVRNEVSVTISGGTAVVTIPASLAGQMYQVKWVLQAFEGTTPVSVAEGKARLAASGNSVQISNSELEISNTSGAPIPVSIDRSTTQPVSGTVELGATTLAALESTTTTTALDAATLAALETINLGPSSQIIGHVSTSLSKKVGEGKVFIGGTAITLGGLASAERACLQLSNPANSGKVLYIFGLTIYSTIAQQVVYTEDATMTGTVTAVTPFNLNRAAAVASVAAVSSSISAPSGGTAWPNQSRVTTQKGLDITLPPVVLPPGKSFLVRGTVGDAQTFTANAYWFEE